jgi:hypothetical protein
MKWLPLSLLTVTMFGLSAAADDPPIPEKAGRYQIVAAQVGSGADTMAVVLKIDTATGRVWRLVLGDRSIYFGEVASLPLDDLIKEDLAERTREEQLERAKTTELWCLRFPEGGTLDVDGQKITVTKAERDRKLKEAREQIARLSKPPR